MMEIEFKLNNEEMEGWYYKVGNKENLANYISYYENGKYVKKICFTDKGLDDVIEALINLRDLNKKYNIE